MNNSNKKISNFYSIILISLWTFSVFVFFLWNYLHIEKSIQDSAVLTARASYEKDIVYRRWNASFGGVYARPNNETSANPFLRKELQTITTDKKETLIMLNPAYMSRLVHELTKKANGIQSRLTSLRPVNPANSPDDWEIQALHQLEKGKTEVVETLRAKNGEVLRFIKPLLTEKSCLFCHAEHGYKEGELRGGLSVIVPMEPYISSARFQKIVLALGHVVIWIFGTFAIAFSVRHYHKLMRHQQDASLKEKEYSTLQLVMDGVGEAIMLISPDYKVLLCNPEAQKFFTAQKMYPGVFCHSAIHDSSEPCSKNLMETCPLAMARNTKKVVNFIYDYVDVNHNAHTMEVTATPLWDENGKFKGIIKTARDITEKVKAEKKLKYLARHDTLTHLPNRFSFEEELVKLINQCDGTDCQIAVFFIDLDRFKMINDSLGHNIGDKVLVEVANRLNKVMSEKGMVARFGGDEFTAVVKTKEDRSILNNIANAIILEILETFSIEDHEFHLSASIGISIFPLDGHDITTLLRSADIALYRAKNSGKNTFNFYEKENENFALRSLRIESGLKSVLNSGMIDVAFQPLVSTSSGKIVGMEALARLTIFDMGTISPIDFIPIAEESGLIIPMGRIILFRACEYCKLWNDVLKEKFIITVNVSPRQFVKQDILHAVRDILEITGLPPENLKLEVTESSIMSNINSSVETLNKIRDMGVKIALDDFGTGYSSLSYLKILPIHSLKIDKSFVKELTTDKRDLTFVKTIIAMAHNLNLEVIAEGVETEEHRKILTSFGCDILQGYLFSKPLLADDFEAKFIKTKNIQFFSNHFDIFKTIEEVKKSIQKVFN